MKDLLEVLSGDKGWISLITGSGGALVVLIWWVRSLLNEVKEKDKELREISGNSVECITKIVEKIEQERQWKHTINAKVDAIHTQFLVNQKVNDLLNTDLTEDKGND